MCEHNCKNDKPMTSFHSVKTKEREMTKDELDSFMNESRIGRLGTCGCGDNGPYIVPVSFGWHKDKVYIHCHHKGKKLDNISQNSRVCFEADSMGAGIIRWKSVIIQGIAEQVTDDAEAISAMTAMMRKYGGNMGSMTVGKMPLSKVMTIFRIKALSLSSRINEQTV